MPWKRYTKTDELKDGVQKLKKLNSLEAESNKLSEKAAELKQDASKTADNLMQEADNKVDQPKGDASKNQRWCKTNAKRPKIKRLIKQIN